jgi:hypothetical protein
LTQCTGKTPIGSKNVPWCDGLLDLLSDITLGFIALDREDFAILEELVENSNEEPITTKIGTLVAKAAFGPAQPDPKLMPGPQCLSSNNVRHLNYYSDVSW